ncbi:ribosome assembly cofactor RimP [Psychroflexus sp. ALD_RP9]|uniref:ribosome assembly cofactor RimP n=1 Tax=Psychroflexus sp. ALD_RP9 TaxID=2777186 RepID=UPI001A8D5C8A|nr:ribosome assembly cofactor RimP [Psychroflexus sp. ALD_RP9]QSS97685.1 ribosome assembly cofactor RimP [Psychroflexus sp. ALD_RP9]
MALDSSHIERLINNALEEHTHLFVVDFEISSQNHIKLVIDGDRDVSIQDCIALSRAVEHNLDREIEDFSLDVSSFGATSPLRLPRQFQKNINRKLEVKLKDQTIKADLVEVKDEIISLQWKAREPKPIGKGKHTVQKTKTIPLQDIIEAKVMINFNKK